MTDKIQKIVIVGAGFAGVKLGLELANKDDFHVTIISDRPAFEYHAALYRSATGKSPLEVVIPLNKIFAHARNVEVVLDEIIEIDHERKVLRSNTQNDYMYDTAVMAIGQKLNHFGIEGLQEKAFSLDNIANTIRLREHLIEMVLSDQEKLNFVVVGGGASGVELAAELPNYIANICALHGREPKLTNVMLVEASDRLLPGLLPKASDKIYKLLKKRGVDIRLKTMVRELDGNTLILDDGTIQTESVIWTAGSKGHPFFGENEVFKTNKMGRVIVDNQLRAAKDIYVLGDGADTKYAGMAQTALVDAEFVAKSLIAKKNGKPLEMYAPKTPIWAVPTGNGTAVLQWHSIVLVGRLAWLLRRMADFRLFANFEPFDQAVKTFRAGSRDAKR